MNAFAIQLREKLASRFSSEMQALLPKGYQRLGHVGIVQLDPLLQPHSTEIGKALLELVPGIQTACMRTGKITGAFRQPPIEWIAGEKNTQVEHHEHGCTFAFDCAKIMWAKGNVSERKRIYASVQPGERVMDFFAGIGYWTIPIARHSKPKKVIAFEANPLAVKYLRKNISLNKIAKGIVEIAEGKCEEKSPGFGRTADRILLGYIPAPFFALPSALACIKENGIIHFEGTAFAGGEGKLFEECQRIAQGNNMKLELLHTTLVKPFGPKINHYTLDLRSIPQRR
ncbi:MAG: class I SAM-dependent methyltransferase family protein [Candidatus Diapherotrites archaeon]|nr:class I SAM-dependent methyltransferase family protein [Candidatus Diapherotrites archaeon]